VPFCHSVLINEYRDRYTPDAELFRDAVILSDRKGDLVSLRELPDVVITAQDKDADKFNALAAIGLIRLLEFGSLLLALRSPVRADAHYHWSFVCRLVLDCFPVNGLEAEISNRFSGISKDREKNDYRSSP
jgi:hypothetical protein